MKQCGIYLIKNKLNNKIYIGSSANIVGRWRTHKKLLQLNIHKNIYLQSVYNKYNVDIFEFSILEECSKEHLIQREQFYLDLYQSYNRDKGYNLCPTANFSVFSEETKKKISLANLGRHPSEETRKKLSKANKGRKMSPEFGLKISKALKGRTFSDIHCLNISKSLSGKKRIKFTEIKHGTTNSYRYHKCRCALCTIAVRDDRRNYLVRKNTNYPGLLAQSGRAVALQAKG